MRPSRALTILRADHPAHTPETEMTLLELDDGNGDIVVTLDDGTTLRWDALELRQAVCELVPVRQERRAA